MTRCGSQLAFSWTEHDWPMSSGAGVGSRRALHGVLIAAVAVGVALLVFRVSSRSVWHNTFDLRVYRGAVRWWLDGHPLYDFLRPHTTKGFTYPPFAVLVLLPLGLVTETTATILFTSVSIGLVLVTTGWLVAPVAARHGWPRWVALGVAVPVAFAMEPVRETIGWGQIDLVIATLVLADTAGLRRGRRWAGLGIGLAAAIKVTPGLFIVYLVVTRRWRAAAVACATFGASVVVGLAVDPTARYWTWALWQTDRVGPPTDPNNQSLLGLLTRASAPATPSHVLWLGVAGLIAIVGMVRAALVQRRGDELAGVTVTGLTACLISPISWVHHLYWVVPATVVLVDITAGSPVVSAWVRRRPGVTRVVAGIAALMVAGVFTSSLIWFYAWGPAGPRTIIGEDAYVLLLLALVLVLPARSNAAAVGDIERPRPSAEDAPGARGALD
jgi:alpha-1,2-mannosyltransferase